jgi:hypothetical protein
MKLHMREGMGCTSPSETPWRDGTFLAGSWFFLSRFPSRRSAGIVALPCRWMRRLAVAEARHASTRSSAQRMVRPRARIAARFCLGPILPSVGRAAAGCVVAVWMRSVATQAAHRRTKSV